MLFDAWSRGDAVSGRRLVTQFYRPVFLFFFRKVDRELARDLTQATFETFCSKRSEFRGDSTVLTFLLGIARWKLVQHAERARVARGRFSSESGAIDALQADASITSLFMGRQRETLLVRALRSLSLDDQMLIELKVHEGLTAKEIARVFGVGRDTAASRLLRARKRLAREVHRLATQASVMESSRTDLDQEMRRIQRQIAELAENFG